MLLGVMKGEVSSEQFVYARRYSLVGKKGGNVKFILCAYAVFRELYCTINSRPFRSLCCQSGSY